MENHSHSTDSLMLTPHPHPPLQGAPALAGASRSGGVSHATRNPASTPHGERGQTKPILCVGTCAWTTIFRVAHLPQGSAKIIPIEAIQIGDGMSASAACAIVKLGGRAEFWARVGDDANGRAAIASLTEAGLDCSNVHYVSGVKGSFCSVVIDSEGERIVIPRHDPALPDDASWLPLERITRGDFSAVLTEVRWPEGAAAVLDAARAAGIPAILDAEVGATGVLEDLAKHATHVLYSETHPIFSEQLLYTLLCAKGLARHNG